MRTFDEDAFVVYQVGGREGGKLFYTAEVPPEVRGRAVAEGSLAEWAQSIIALDAAVFGPFDEIARAQRRVLAQPVVRALWQGDAGLFGLGPRATGRSRDAALVLRRDWGVFTSADMRRVFRDRFASPVDNAAWHFGTVAGAHFAYHRRARNQSAPRVHAMTDALTPESSPVGRRR